MGLSYGTDKAAYESALARAHKALWQAQARAEMLGWEVAHDKLYELQVEVIKLSEQSLKSKQLRLRVS